MAVDPNPSVPSNWSPVKLGLVYSGSDAFLSASIQPGTLQWEAFTPISGAGVIYNNSGVVSLLTAPFTGAVLRAVGGNPSWGLLPPSAVVSGSLSGMNNYVVSYDEPNDRFQLKPVAAGSGLPPDGVYGNITVSATGLTWTIRDSTVGTNQIINSAVTNTKIADGAVTVGKIQDTAVTGT